MRHLLFLVTEDWYFCSHRLDLARAAVNAGYKVTLLTSIKHHGDIIREAGINLIEIKFRRSHKNLFQDLCLILTLFRLYREQEPDIVHHVSLKPVLYGSFVALFCGRMTVINAVTGLGYLFSSGNKLTAMLRMLVKPVLLRLLNPKHSWVILQNRDDRTDLIAEGMRSDHSELIKGSGVDLEKFSYSVESNAIPVIVLAARMLRYKGIAEFVEAASLCIKRGLKARFILVGDVDVENPMSLTREDLEQWHSEGVVEWWGHRNDMPEIMSLASIVCLPTYYREGLPKTLLEAAASGRPVIATDVPGCREIVVNEKNGLLVPVRNVERLVWAIMKLAKSKQSRIKMGKYGRKLVEAEFSVDIINRKTLALYERALFA